MKRLFITLTAVALLLGLAWLVPHSLFSVTVATPTPPLATVDATASTPTVDAYPLSENIPVTYENVSFEIPAGLATGADGQTGAAIQAEPGFNTVFDAPAFIQLTLRGYPFPAPSGYPQPEVRIYPAAEYAQVSGWAAESLKRLQNVLANPSAPLENASLPNVPFMGSAAQLYAAQAQRMAFKNGNGVRMISSYAQYPAPVSRYDSFYHYEGLTQDGKYWVVVTMPVGLPVYSDATNPGENGITYPNYQAWADVEPYYSAMTNLLNAASPEGFNPMLGQLDALVQSITVGEAPASLSATPQSGTPCPSLLAGTELMTNFAEGYCLLYPAGYSAAMAHYIVINPVNAPGGDMPGDAWLSITMESAVGRTAAQVAEAQIAVAGTGFNITTMPLVIDNEPAVVVDGLPGQDSTRKVLIVHADRLYTLTFTPWYPSPAGAAQLTPLEDLYTLVTQTFRFLP